MILNWGGGPTAHKPQATSLTRRILNDKVKTMKTITYKNKKIKLPFDVLYDDGDIVTETNPFSGESIDLPDFARGVYYIIKNAEIAEDYKKMEKGLNFFRQYFPKEYMVLLD